MKLYEISTIGPGRSAVDRENGVIKGVRILGRESKNGREYSDRALQEAAKKYEGVDVNVNHPDRKSPNSERRIEDGIGWLESVEVRKDGVYADLHYLKEHQSSGLLAEAAERRSNRFGLSHNAQGTVKRVNGKNVVESIERVLSVDLVQNPATNAGLFESESRTIREVLEQHDPEMLKRLTEDAALLPPEALDEPAVPGATDESKAAAKAALVQLLTAMVEMPGDITELATQLIAVAQKVIAGAAEAEAEEEAEEGEEKPGDEAEREEETEPAAEEPAEPAADSAEEEDPFKKMGGPMAESTSLKAIEQRLNLLESENRQLKEQQELRDLKDKCETLLRTHRRDVTSARLTALANMPDDAGRMALIEEWEPVLEAAAAPPRKQRPNFSAPIREVTDHKYPSDLKSFVEACR